MSAICAGFSQIVRKLIVACRIASSNPSYSWQNALIQLILVNFSPKHCCTTGSALTLQRNSSIPLNNGTMLSRMVRTLPKFQGSMPKIINFVSASNNCWIWCRKSSVCWSKWLKEFIDFLHLRMDKLDLDEFERSDITGHWSLWNSLEWIWTHVVNTYVWMFLL